MTSRTCPSLQPHFLDGDDNYGNGDGGDHMTSNSDNIDF